MKKSVLVALSDRNFVEKTKQLFSSVYFNSGWPGDYLLLSHDIPEKELKWFRKKGIIVKKVKPLKKLDDSRWSSVILSKFYLFTPYFKKWESVIYLDSDIIVKCSLDKLINVKGFNAPTDCSYNLKWQFKNKWSKNKLLREIKEKYNLKKISFNVGIIAFSTDIINKDMFNQLKYLYKGYYSIIKYPEQAILNIYFYKKWKKLSNFYYVIPHLILDDVFPLIPAINNKLAYQSKDGVRGILHFSSDKKYCKPWDERNYFNKEWKENLDRADRIDLKKRLKQPDKYNGSNISFKIYHSLCFFLNLSDRKIGQFVGIIKSKIPLTRKFLKRTW